MVPLQDPEQAPLQSLDFSARGARCIYYRQRRLPQGPWLRGQQPHTPKPAGSFSEIPALSAPAFFNFVSAPVWCFMLSGCKAVFSAVKRNNLGFPFFISFPPTP